MFCSSDLIFSTYSEKIATCKSFLLHALIECAGFTHLKSLEAADIFCKYQPADG
jgi:hypothetical protein